VIQLYVHLYEALRCINFPFPCTGLFCLYIASFYLRSLHSVGHVLFVQLQTLRKAAMLIQYDVTFHVQDRSMLTFWRVGIPSGTATFLPFQSLRHLLRLQQSRIHKASLPLVRPRLPNIIAPSILRFLVPLALNAL
jgi:hypothetical protein